MLPPGAIRWSDPSDGSIEDHDHGHSHGHGHSHEDGGEDGRGQGRGDTGGEGKETGPLRPTHIEPRGNYAVRIDWSDGHEHPFFTYDALMVVAARHTEAMAK